MLDTAPAKTTATQATNGRTWPERIASGDIVSFRFPTDDETGSSRPKARPCLVLAVGMIDGQRRLLVAYGSTVLSKARNRLGIIINANEACACGLDRATGFRGDRITTINTSDPALAVSPIFRTPVIGRLTGRPLVRMHSVQAQLQMDAEASAMPGDA